jgi:hypothetical protein
LRGWQFRYLLDVECPSELPVEMNAFKTQQARWAKGLMQTAKKLLPRLLRADLPGPVKAEAFFHLTANVTYPLMVVFSALLLPAMIVRFYQGWLQMLLIDLPIFLASSCSISGFYMSAQRALNPKSWFRSFFYMPFVMAVGIGLSVRNAKAVLEAVFGHQSEFARTPKYNISGPGQSGAAGSWRSKLYRNRAGWIPYVEVGLGLYFSGAIWYAISNENYATVPFLLLFVWGYLYTGLMSLFQGSFQRWRRSADSAQDTGLPEVALPAAPASAAASAPTTPAS